MPHSIAALAVFLALLSSAYGQNIQTTVSDLLGISQVGSVTLPLHSLAGHGTAA